MRRTRTTTCSRRVERYDKEKAELQAKLSAAASDAANLEKQRRVRHPCLLHLRRSACELWSSRHMGFIGCRVFGEWVAPIQPAVHTRTS